MKVTLHTLCGCTRTLEIARPLRRLEVPIPTRFYGFGWQGSDGDTIVPFPTADAYTTRHFSLEHESAENGLEYYEISTACPTCKRAKQLLDTYGMDEGL